MAAATKNRRITGRGVQPESISQWLGLNEGASIGLLVLLALVLASGLSVVYLTYKNRYLFNELQGLRDRANEFDVQRGQLLIEQSTLGLGGRIEQKATDLLQLRIPDVEHIIMITNEQTAE